MSDIKISLDSAGESGSITIVRVDGVIDTMTATELEKVMNSLLERNKYRIIVDLGGVDYISSAGWGIFISNIREIRQHDGDIKLARMIPNVYEIFELLEFDSILRAFDSLEKAKSDFDGDSGEGAPRIVEPVLAARPQNRQSLDETQVGAPESDDLSRNPVELKSAHETVPLRESAGRRNLESLVLEMVSKDPFYSITEINGEIAKKHSNVNSGWWKIWGILRRNGLLTRKSRFRRARNKTGEN